MSNYTIAVAWNNKDALQDSDAAKVISGDDFWTEFSAIQVAVNTKADLSGSGTQAFAAATAVAGTNTTQVATTAYTTAAIAAATPTLGVDGVIIDGAALATGKVLYIDNGAPTGGNNGDVWFEY